MPWLKPARAAGWSFRKAADWHRRHADILWQHSSGTLAEWLLDGASYVGGGVFTGPSADWR